MKSSLFVAIDIDKGRTYTFFLSKICVFTNSLMFLNCTASQINKELKTKTLSLTVKLYFQHIRIEVCFLYNHSNASFLCHLNGFEEFVLAKKYNRFHDDFPLAR